MKEKPIKVKKLDRVVSKEMMELEAVIDEKISIMVKEIGYMRTRQSRVHNDIWNDIVKTYKLDLKKGTWCYNIETKTLRIKEKTAREQYDEIEKEKTDAEWKKTEDLAEKVFEMKRTEDLKKKL